LAGPNFELSTIVYLNILLRLGNEEIKFHEPADFVKQAGGVPDQVAHGGGSHPEARVSHSHSLRGGPDHEKE
jgi:hypothetical protein